MKKKVYGKIFESLDYKISGDLLKNYSNMRLVALGGATTLIIALISISPTKEFISILLWGACLLLSIFISIRVIGSINANVYARCIHMEWLEEKLNVIGFFSYWNKYVLNKSINASSNAFLKSCIAFNLVGFILAFIVIFQALRISGVLVCQDTRPFISFSISDEIDYIELIFSSMFFIANILIFKKNINYINNYMRTKSLIPRLEKELYEIRQTMSKMVNPKDNSANINNPNKGTSGTNKQYDKNQGNKGRQLNRKGKKK